MGKFCVTSNIASKPETSGSFFEYFDPLDIHSTVAAIERRIVDRAYPARRDAAIGRCGLLRRVHHPNGEVVYTTTADAAFLQAVYGDKVRID